MLTVDARTATCRVLTFKEGALSALAHDVELDVTSFTIRVTSDHTVEATFDATSLRVLHAMKDGRPTTALGDGDKRKIAATIVDDVLAARRHPEIRYRATAEPAGDGFVLTGELTLHGRTRPLRVTTHREGYRHVTEVVLHQPDFGIKPYSAILGTLKVKPDVRVRITVPLA